MNPRRLRNENDVWSRSECCETPSGLDKMAPNNIGTAISPSERRIADTKAYNSNWAFVRCWILKRGSQRVEGAGEIA